jgi:hypothetical protein
MLQVARLRSHLHPVLDSRFYCDIVVDDALVPKIGSRFKDMQYGEASMSPQQQKPPLLLTVATVLMVHPLNTATTFANGVNPAVVPSPQMFPALPLPTTRIACPLSYDFSVRGEVGAASQFSLSFVNSGLVGTALIAYWMPMADAQTTFQYTIEAGKSLVVSPVAVGADGVYDWAVHGPDGFVREFRGNVTNIRLSGQMPEVTTHDDGGSARSWHPSPACGTDGTTCGISSTAAIRRSRARCRSSFNARSQYPRTPSTNRCRRESGLKPADAPAAEPETSGPIEGTRWVDHEGHGALRAVAQ